MSQTLNTGGWSLVSSSSVLWGKQQTCADKAKARQLIRMVNEVTKPVSLCMGEGAAGQQRESFSGLTSSIQIQALNLTGCETSAKLLSLSER